jgi:hypothetical protein
VWLAIEPFITAAVPTTPGLLFSPILGVVEEQDFSFKLSKLS